MRSSATKAFAEKVLFGNIYTSDRKNPRAQAAAISGGRFVYVGDAAGDKRESSIAKPEFRNRLNIIYTEDEE